MERQETVSIQGRTVLLHRMDASAFAEAMVRREWDEARALQGRVLDAEGEEVLLAMDHFGLWDIPEQVLSPMVRHPFAGANRKAKRAAEVRARRAR